MDLEQPKKWKNNIMESQTSNIRQLPLKIKSNNEMIQEALRKGASRAKIILTKNIAVANWNRLQCQFGCQQGAHGYQQYCCNECYTGLSLA